MNSQINALFTLLLLTAASTVCLRADEPPPTEFDEELIQAIFDDDTHPYNVTWMAKAAALFEQFEAATTDQERADIYREILEATADDILLEEWEAPAGGWPVYEFSDNPPTVEDVTYQQGRIASTTKLAVEDELSMVKLRSTMRLLSGSAFEGERWTELLLLDIVEGPQDNLRLIAFWSALEFGTDLFDPSWEVNWPRWEAAFQNSDPMGKSIILRNCVMLSLRFDHFEAAGRIHLAGLNDPSKSVQAVALASGIPALGDDVVNRWIQIAEDGSDSDLQALANETLEFHRIPLPEGD